jgi:hypothetical protein
VALPSAAFLLVVKYCINTNIVIPLPLEFSRAFVLVDGPRADEYHFSMCIRFWMASIGIFHTKPGLLGNTIHRSGGSRGSPYVLYCTPLWRQPISADAAEQGCEDRRTERSQGTEHVFSIILRARRGRPEKGSLTLIIRHGRSEPIVMLTISRLRHDTEGEQGAES